MLGIPEKRDPEPLEDPEPYRDPELYDDSVLYEDQGPYEDSEFFDNPGKTQELDFHIMCLISGIYN